VRRAGLFWLRARAVLTPAAPGIDARFYFAASHEQFLPQLHVFLQAHPFTQVQVSAFTQPQDLFAQRHSFWFVIGFSLVPGALARRHPCRRRCRGGITGGTVGTKTRDPLLLRRRRRRKLDGATLGEQVGKCGSPLHRHARIHRTDRIGESLAQLDESRPFVLVRGEERIS
jgi:hypothetical protein